AIGSNSCRVSRLHFIWTQHEKKKSETAIKTIFLSTAEKRNRRVVVTKEDTRRVLDGSEGRASGRASEDENATSEADKCFYLPNSSELMGLNVPVVQGHGCERKSRVCFAVFPFTGLKEVTGVKFHFYK
ncbi:hypothetical protein HID58_027933, partial [Brassica napus]